MTDPRARADFRRDQLKDSFACRNCGSPDPAIIRGGGCSDCRCMLAGHVERCGGTPHRAEGHVLKRGWIAFDDDGGARIEVEVA